MQSPEDLENTPLNKLFTVIVRKFKFQVQDSDLEYLFWRFDKHIALSGKKPPLPGICGTEICYIFTNTE